MARRAGFSEEKQYRIAKESETESQAKVGERYGIKKGSVCFYRKKFGITKSPEPTGRPRIDIVERNINNDWLYALHP